MNQKPLLLEKWDFIVLLGESGGGKGTLVQNVLRYWLPDLNTASMGDVFRKKAATDEHLRDLTNRGVLIDDEITCKIFREFALENAPGLIDGFPRKREQAIDLIRFVKDNNWRVLVVDLQCNIDRIIQRLLARKRADDNLNIVYKRHTDHKNLHPHVMEELRNRPDLFDIITVDGNHDHEVVFSSFLLEVLRLVDMLYFYDMSDVKTTFKVNDSETTINPAINRWFSGFLNSVQKKFDEREN